MGLTSVALFVTVLVVAGGMPWVLLLLWRRGARSSRLAALLVLLSVVLAQVTAIAAVAIGVNRAFGFFPTWGALLGRPPPVPALRGLPAPSVDPRVLAEPAGDVGRMRTATVSGARSGIRDRILVWLPPQYDDAAFAGTRFPVVTVLGPAYLSVATFAGQLDFPRAAAAGIRSGRLAPFVAVFPEVNVQLPLDTECADLPRGSQGYTWLASDVPEWVARTLRVTPPGRAWGVTGFSTGGYCSAKLHLRAPRTFGAAASLEGYFEPELDGTTGNLRELLDADPALARANSPQSLVQEAAAGSVRMLVMTSRDDPQSYAASQRFLRLAGDQPGLRLWDVPDAGHSFAVVRAVLPTALAWLQQQRES